MDAAPIRPLAVGANAIGIERCFASHLGPCPGGHDDDEAVIAGFRSCLSFLYLPIATLRVLEDFRTVQAAVARNVDREIVVKWPLYAFFRGTHSCKLITS